MAHPTARGLKWFLIVLTVGSVTATVVSCAGVDQPAPPTQSAGAAVRAFGDSLGLPGPTRLLKVDELRQLPAFGFDIREQPVLDPKQFSLASIKGPCGTTIATPFKDLKSAKVFRSTITLVIEAMAEVGAETSRSFVDVLAADRVDKCPSFEERIGNEPSTVTYQKTIDLPPVGDQRLGWTDKIVSPDGTVGYRSELVIRDRSRVVLLVILSTREIDSVHFQELVQVASAGR